MHLSHQNTHTHKYSHTHTHTYTYTTAHPNKHTQTRTIKLTNTHMHAHTCKQHQNIIYHADYLELIITMKFSLLAIDDLLSKSPEINNYSFSKKTEITESFLQETQQQIL